MDGERLNSIMSSVGERDILKLLIEEKSVIFFAKDIESPVKVIYNTFEKTAPDYVKSIKHVLELIDAKSGIAEVYGFVSYSESLKNKILNCKQSCRIYIPINDGDKTSIYSMKVSMLDDNKEGYKYLCYLVVEDNESFDIERLFSTSYKDSLTHLFNRNALVKHMNEGDSPHFFGFMDLDGFKFINDTYSHYVGNELLTQIGKELIKIANNNVVFYRYAGDEFVFMTNGYNEKEALEYAELIRKTIEQIEFKGNKQSFSIGIAEYVPNFGYSMLDTIKLADIAMYKAKSTGRNKIVYLTKENAKVLLGFSTINELLEKHIKPRNDKGLEELAEEFKRKMKKINNIK